MAHRFPRRTFLKDSVVAGAGLALPPSVFRPERAVSWSVSWSQFRGQTESVSEIDRQSAKSLYGRARNFV